MSELERPDFPSSVEQAALAHYAALAPDTQGAAHDFIEAHGLVAWYMWVDMGLDERRDTILQNYNNVEDWLGDDFLPVLMCYRSSARAWARIKARYKRIGGNPFDLEKACDQLIAMAPHVPPSNGTTPAINPDLSNEQRLHVLLASPNPDLWYAHLDVLAAVRPHPAQWGLVKERAKRLHLSPYDLQLAVDEYCRSHKVQPHQSSMPPDETLERASLAVSLATLSEEWGIPLDACIRHGMDNATWHLRQPDGKEISLGPTKNLLNEHLVRVAIFDATGKMIQQYGKQGQERWRELMEIIAAIAVTVDTPEMTALGQARALLAGYLENEEFRWDPRDYEETEGWEHLAAENRPFLREAKLHVHARHIWSSYARIMMPECDYRTILECLRLLGGYRVTVALHEPVKSSRSLWVLPLTGFALENGTIV